VSRVARNIAFNFSGQFLLIGLSLIAVRFVFRQLGADSLAVILAALTLGAILSATLDLGVASLTVREVSAHAASDRAYVQKLIGTASLFYWLIFIALGLAVYFLSPWIVDRWFRLETLDPALATQTLQVLGIGSLSALPRSLYTGVLRGLERMEFNNGIDVAVTALQQVGMLALLWFGAGLLPIAYCYAVCFAAGLLAYVAVVARLLGWRVLLPTFSAEVVRRNVAYAASMFVVSAVAPIHLQADRVLVSKLLPFANFGTYATASRLVGAGSLPTSAVAQAAFPSFSSLARANDRTQLTIQYRKLQDFLCLGSVIVFAGIAFSALPLLSLVFNRAVANTLVLPTAILCFGAYLNTTVQLPYMVALAMGKPMTVAKTNLYGLFIVLPAATALTFLLGLSGAAMTLVVFDLFIYAYMMPRICADCLEMSVWDWYGHIARILLLAGATYGVGLLLAVTLGSGGLGALLVAFAVATAAYLLVAQALMPGELKESLTRLGRSLSSPAGATPKAGTRL
jgi:O-antigen/teichoic acid export membrane protein